jgi:hypothetical protein
VIIEDCMVNFDFILYIQTSFDSGLDKTHIYIWAGNTTLEEHDCHPMLISNDKIWNPLLISMDEFREFSIISGLVALESCVHKIKIKQVWYSRVGEQNALYIDQKLGGRLRPFHSIIEINVDLFCTQISMPRPHQKIDWRLRRVQRDRRYFYQLCQ